MNAARGTSALSEQTYLCGRCGHSLEYDAEYEVWNSDEGFSMCPDFSTFRTELHAPLQAKLIGPSGDGCHIEIDGKWIAFGNVPENAWKNATIAVRNKYIYEN